MKTERVRIAVAITSHGAWEAVGSHNLQDVDSINSAKEALESYMGSNLMSIHWIEADVPIPEIGIIKGEVIN